MIATLPRALVILLVAAIFLLINGLADRGLSGARLDLTADQLFTVSDGTREVLDGLEEPITLRLFFSEKLASSYPSIFTYGRRIRDLLEEYEALADGKIDLRVIDPEPFSEAEDQAVGYGIRGVPTEGGQSLFLGLAASDSTDREATIALFAEDRERFLEYDLTKLIYELSEPSLPRVAVLSGAPVFGQPPNPLMGGPGQQPWAAFSQLEQLFDVTRLEPSFEALPTDVDLLILIHPPELTDAQAYALDQYALSGGRLLVFVDPNAESVPAGGPMEGMGGPGASDLPRPFDAWGLSLSSGQVVADFDLAQQVNFGGGGPRAIRDYIVWLGLTPAQIDREDVVTGTLDLVTMGTAGALEHDPQSGTNWQPLLRSSAASALISTDLLMGEPDPDALIQATNPDDRSKVLAGRLGGQAQSAFPDGPDGSGAPEGHRSQGPVNAIVVADVDMLDDRFWVQVQQFFGQQILQPFADNGSLLVNAADNLVGAEALIALRGRGVSQRPFEVVEDIRREAEASYLAREQALEMRLAETEARLAELEGQRPADGALVSPAQQAEIEAFRAQALETRSELRAVQRDLRRDIEALESRLAFVNIVGMPLLLVAFAFGLTRWRRHRAARP